MALTDDITEIIAAQRSYADDATRAAISAAKSASGKYYPPQIYTNLSFRNTAPVPGNIGAPPVFSAVYTAPTSDASLADLKSLYVPTIPEFGDAPSALDTSDLFKQVAPVYDVAAFDETSPTVDTDLDIPDAPTIVMPDTPTITDITLPDAPDITIPDFTAIDTDATDPGVVGDIVAFSKATYENSLPVMRGFLDDVVSGWMQTYAPGYADAMAKLEAKISSGIDGGTAMSDVIEQQIFDRAKDRAEIEANRASEDLLEGMSKRGYSIPPAAVSAGLNQIQQATAKSLAATAAETAIARAKLEQEHTQFIMNLSSTLNLGLIGTAVQYAQQLVIINGQSLEYSKQLAASMVSEYNLKLERYKAELQLAGIATQVYEAQLKAALADITIFESEIRAAELSKNIEKIDVDLYATLIKSESLKIDTYVAELQGVSTAASLEKLKVEIYGEQVRAYVSQVGAKKAEFDVYTAAIGGDEAKVRAYATQVQAYGQEVNASKAIADVEIAHSRAVADYNKNIIDEFRAELAAYGAELDVAKTTFGAESEAYRAKIDAYKAFNALQLESYNANYKHAALELDAAKAALSGDLQKEVAEREIAQRGIAAGGSTAVGVANAMASLAGSAASATNTITTVALESTG